jgi:hypothetical protein
MDVESFALSCCPVVAKTIIRTAEMADIAIRFRECRARDHQNLFPHFGEAGEAIFAVEEIEDGGHDRPPSSDQTLRYHFSPVQYVIWITAPLKELGRSTRSALDQQVRSSGRRARLMSMPLTIPRRKHALQRASVRRPRRISSSRYVPSCQGDWLYLKIALACFSKGP